MNKKQANSHLFALYYPTSSSYKVSQQLTITEDDLVHRMQRVLRLSQGDTCILFDSVSWLELIITAVTRTTITGNVNAKHAVKPWQPNINFFLPILKREALAIAVYDLVQAGVQEIQLIQTQKVQHALRGTQELQRLQRIIIAAAEQSKNFAFPQIKAPITWQEFLAQIASVPTFVGNPAGKPLFATIKEYSPEATYNLLVGPEGGFTSQEYTQLQKANVIEVSLIPTILKAETAAFYLAALLRSYFNA